MVIAADKVIEIVKKYIEELKMHDIPVEEAILFGSFAQGRAREESDIDLAIISSAFTGDRFADRRLIVPLRRGVDSRIEPMPFRPEQFAEGGNLIDQPDRRDQTDGSSEEVWGQRGLAFRPEMNVT